MSRKKKTVTQVYARIYDEETAEEMRKLVAMKEYHSMSEVLSNCIELAMPILTGHGKEKHAKSMEYDVKKAISQQTAALRDMSIQLTMMFNLVVGLFRERELALQGVRTNGKDLAEGKYEVLSEYYQDRLNDLMKL